MFPGNGPHGHMIKRVLSTEIQFLGKRRIQRDNELIERLPLVLLPGRTEARRPFASARRDCAEVHRRAELRREHWRTAGDGDGETGSNARSLGPECSNTTRNGTVTRSAALLPPRFFDRAMSLRARSLLGGELKWRPSRGTGCRRHFQCYFRANWKRKSRVRRGWQ
jgi:hypothetical protein